MDTVNPGGTGSPALVISARFAPLPPSRSRIVRSPSAEPPPKKYTYFALGAACLPADLRVDELDLVFLADGFLDMRLNPVLC